MSWPTVADQISLLADTRGQALHQHQFRRSGVQCNIAAIDAHVALQRVRLQQVPAGQKSRAHLPVHVRGIPHTRVADRT